MVMKKIYYPGKGGAFRLFVAENKIDVYLTDFKNALTKTEQIFIEKYAPKIGLRNNLQPFQNLTGVYQYEWYSLTNHFLNHIHQNGGQISDICGDILTLNDLSKAYFAAEKIRNKLCFYKMVQKINPNYLLPNWKINKLENKKIEYPLIIKSSQGKGGKGNIVCYSDSDFNQCRKILSSKLFAKKQENEQYNPLNKIIIEKFYPNAASYNCSFYCTKKGKIKFQKISQQIIEEVFYRGNIYPPLLTKSQLKDITEISGKICHICHSDYGYVGWLGLDFILLNGKIHVIEANPRVNSVTHAHEFSKGKPFFIRLMRHKAMQLTEIFDKFILDPETRYGIVPYQIPDNENVLLISVNSTLEKAENELKRFAQANGLENVTQENILSFSKSVSYYCTKL